MLDIFIKDIKLLLSDKKALSLIILMPIVLTSILSFALSGSFQESGDTWKLSLAVVKLYDAGDDVEKFDDFMVSFSETYGIDGDFMDDLEELKGEFDPEEIFFEDFLKNDDLVSSVDFAVYEEEEAYRLLKGKEVNAVIILPDGFVYDSYINMLTTFRNKIGIKVVKHPEMSYSGRIAEELVKGFNSIMASMSISKNVYMEKSMSVLDLEKTVANLDLFMESLDLKGFNADISIRGIEGKNHIDSFAYYSVAMMSMFILFSAGYGGKFILDEKNNRTYFRMLASGIDKRKIMAGKFMMMAVLVMLQSWLLIVFSKFILKIDWINIPLVALTVFISALAVASLGSFIMGITLRSNSYKAVDAFTSAIVQLLAFLGGSYIPLEVLPKAVRTIGRYTPNGAVLKSYIRILEGYGLRDISSAYGILAANIIFFLAASVILIGGAKNAESTDS